VANLCPSVIGVQQQNHSRPPGVVGAPRFFQLPKSFLRAHIASGAQARYAEGSAATAGIEWQVGQGFLVMIAIG
jgi:hypothetical protein